MKPAVVDIGSNTVKMKIYDVIDGKLNEIYSSVNNAKLISYIVNGNLRFEGITLLCNIISTFKKQAADRNADSFSCFATASLRRTDNIEEITETVSAVCGEKIDLVSGEDEAFYSFSGVKHTTCCFPDKVLLIDMGGGSTEVVKCEGGQRSASESMGFGSLSLWLDYEKQGFDAMKTKAAETFRQTSVYPFITDNAILVGGTALAISKLYGILFSDAHEQKMTYNGLKELYEYLKKYDGEIIRLLEKNVPHRVTTVVPGLAAYLGIFEETGIMDITVSTCGIREGYVYEKIMKEQGVL